MILRKVIQVYAVKDYKVYLYFDDGSIRLYDAKALINKGVFKKLQDEEFYLTRATVLNDTLAWDVSGNFDERTCLDLDPNVLYEDSIEVCDPLEKVNKATTILDLENSAKNIWNMDPQEYINILRQDRKLITEPITQEDILAKLKLLKEKYDAQGFIFLGLFGSYARGGGDNTVNSDIDILYKLEKKYVDRYAGFKFFAELEKIQFELENIFGRNVDLVDVDALKELGKKYILPEVIYV